MKQLQPNQALPSDFVEIAFRYEYRNGPNKTAGKQADGMSSLQIAWLMVGLSFYNLLFSTSLVGEQLIWLLA
jgi:hypothetical protein